MKNNKVPKLKLIRTQAGYTVIGVLRPHTKAACLTKKKHFGITTTDKVRNRI